MNNYDQSHAGSISSEPDRDHDSRVLEFGAGLGDCLQQTFKTRAYTCLETLQKPINVILMSHNPFTGELFDHHPSRRRIILHRPKEHPFSGGEWRRRMVKQGLNIKEMRARIYNSLGLDIRQRFCPPTEVSPFDVKFYCSPSEDDLLRSMLSEPYIVMQPFAGSPPRNLPRELVNTLLKRIAAVTDKRIFIIGRSFNRTDFSGRFIHGTESPEIFDLNAQATNLASLNLSVPATVKLVKHCDCFIGAHSSMHLVAWHYRRNVVVSYPSGYTDYQPGKLGKAYTFGVHLPNTYAESFDRFDPRQDHLYICPPDEFSPSQPECV